VQPRGVKRCAVSQQQLDEKTRQRLLALELQPRGDKAEGILILPFGLAVDKNVTLKAGDVEVGPPLRFKTCLPQGCLVPLNLDAKAIAALRKASVLTVGAAGDADQPTNFPISLQGFAPALDRPHSRGLFYASAKYPKRYIVKVQPKPTISPTIQKIAMSSGA
jgi:invasion protein IalB